MASETLFTGKVKCLDGDTSEIVAELIYGTPSKTTPAKAWSDPTADPLADLRAGLRLVSNQCGASADLVVMGKNAADAFEVKSECAQRVRQDAHQSRNSQRCKSQLGCDQSGLVSRSRLARLRSRIRGQRRNDETIRPRRLRPDRFERSAGCFSYAGVSQVDQDERTIRVYEGARIPMISYENFEDIRKFRLSSRPVPVPQNLSAWTILDVL